MKNHSLILAVMVGTAAIGCSGKASTSQAGDTSPLKEGEAMGPNETNSPGSSSPLSAPLKHRETAPDCEDERLSQPPLIFAEASMYVCIDDSDCVDLPSCSGPYCRPRCLENPVLNTFQCTNGFNRECLQDADCTEGDNGRCLVGREGTHCTYDTCFSDSDCTTGGPCGCRTTPSIAVNSCLGGNCQIDSDCEASVCSPTFGGCGSNGGVVAYYCHTPSDTCSNDSDCISPESGSGYCMFQSEVGHWACGYAFCVG